MMQLTKQWTRNEHITKQRNFMGLHAPPCFMGVPRSMGVPVSVPNYEAEDKSTTILRHTVPAQGKDEFPEKVAELTIFLFFRNPSGTGDTDPGPVPSDAPRKISYFKYY